MSEFRYSAAASRTYVKNQVAAALAPYAGLLNLGPSHLGYYNLVQTGTPSVGTIAADALLISPFLVTRTITITELRQTVTAAGMGSTFTFALYNDTGFGYPNALVYQSANYPSDVAVSTITDPCNLVLTPGTYWTGGRIQTSGTLPTINLINNNVASSIPIGTTSNAQTAKAGYSAIGITGAFPATWPGTMTAPTNMTPRNTALISAIA